MFFSCRNICQVVAKKEVNFCPWVVCCLYSAGLTPSHVHLLLVFWSWFQNIWELLPKRSGERVWKKLSGNKPEEMGLGSSSLLCPCVGTDTNILISNTPWASCYRTESNNFPLDVEPQMVNLDQTWDLFSSGDFYCLQKLHVEEWDFMALNCLILENWFFPQGLFFFNEDERNHVILDIQ